VTRYEEVIYEEVPDLAILLAETRRIVQFTVPTTMQVAYPETRSARITANRLGRRDEEIASIDVSRMNSAAKRLLKAYLFNTGRYPRAKAKFPNLKALDDVDLEPGALDDFRLQLPHEFESWGRLFPNDPTR